MILLPAAVAVLLGSAVAAGAQGVQVLSYTALPGWSDDDHAAALAAFNLTCPDLSDQGWQAICALASRNPPARVFFERFFLPVALPAAPPDQVVFTAYYEPVLQASRTAGRGFEHPLMMPPPGMGSLGPSRAAIEDGALAGQGLEIAWLRDPMDLYFLQMQGSGQLDLGNGERLRVGFAAQNGHPRRHIAARLVSAGHIADHQASARVIRNWALRNPGLAAEIRRSDPSYVFFRVLPTSGGGAAASGPVGAMGQPLTPFRSVAVDPRHVPLGAPVWIEPADRPDLNRLAIAQDTGGAIRGPQRADVFTGSGPEAEEIARHIRSGGRIVVLYPVAMALDLAGL
jgi:membrane-bound lytic murein transglycosylase A